MTITNTGKQPDRLIGGTLSIAKRLEVHEMRHEDGVMKMRELEKGLEIKPGETIALKPGGYHVMFMDLNGTPATGTTIDLTLTFQNAGAITVKAEVRAQ